MAEVTEMTTDEITERLGSFVNHDLLFDVHCENGSVSVGVRISKAILGRVSLKNSAAFLWKGGECWFFNPPTEFSGAQRSKVIAVCEYKGAE